MKKTLILCLSLILFLVGIASAAEKAPQKVIDLANTTLTKLGKDPVIINAVKSENAKGKTMSKIKEMDKKWIATPGVTDNMKALMVSTCGKYLQNLQNSASYYAELFVMDNQGANVAMTDKTSDYWQGDEAKFIKAYNNGEGSIHISDVKFDDSTQAYVVQVSVPVMDGGKAIGAITIGIDIDKIE